MYGGRWDFIEPSLVTANHSPGTTEMVPAKDPRGTRVHREAISAYLRGADVEIWPPERWRRESKAKAAIEVITGSDAAKPAIPGFAGPINFNPNPENLSTKGKASSKAAIEVITGFGVGLSGKESENSQGVGSASTCEPYREIQKLMTL
jgi:hypothetical protein